MTLACKFDVRPSWTLGSSLDLSTPQDAGGFKNILRSFTNGTGNSQMSKIWHDLRRLTPSSGTDDLDLAGSLSDAFGTTLTFTTIKAMYVENIGTASTGTPIDAEDILLGGAGSNEFQHWINNNTNAEIRIRTGGTFCLVAPYTGYTVTAGTADILRVLIAGSGSYDVYYRIILAGV